ncbi:unnamed protein product [Amoebophrya sp. A120]|nr:unnamed protein product [Amoebophrya sp. A120]|eukprot:GSA120T00023522001.1
MSSSRSKNRITGVVGAAVSAAFSALLRFHLRIRGSRESKGWGTGRVAGAKPKPRCEKLEDNKIGDDAEYSDSAAYDQPGDETAFLEQAEQREGQAAQGTAASSAATAGGKDLSEAGGQHLSEEQRHQLTEDTFADITKMYENYQKRVVLQKERAEVRKRLAVGAGMSEYDAVVAGKVKSETGTWDVFVELYSSGVLRTFRERDGNRDFFVDAAENADTCPMREVDTNQDAKISPVELHQYCLAGGDAGRLQAEVPPNAESASMMELSGMSQWNPFGPRCCMATPAEEEELVTPQALAEMSPHQIANLRPCQEVAYDTNPNERDPAEDGGTLYGVARGNGVNFIQPGGHGGHYYRSHTNRYHEGNPFPNRQQFVPYSGPGHRLGADADA